MWSDIVGKPLLNQKYLPIKHWNFISKLAIFSDSRYTTLKHPFLIISLPSFQRIWLYSYQDTPVPQPLLVSPVLQPTQISVSYTLIPASRVLSWALFNSLLVTTIETWPLTFCPLCLVIPLWVNLVFTFFTPIPELPRGIRESQINRVLPWKKIHVYKLNQALQVIPQWYSSLMPWLSLPVWFPNLPSLLKSAARFSLIHITVQLRVKTLRFA